MSVNHYKDHLLILPEDDANRQLANGFLKDPALNLRRVQVLPIAGGWSKVRDTFIAAHVAQLKKYPLRHLVLLIDFDEQVEERTRIFKNLFSDLSSNEYERVYLLGTRTEPEPLRKSCGISLEKIGEQLARDCAVGKSGLWQHEFLEHNQTELGRLESRVKPFLFP